MKVYVIMEYNALYDNWSVYSVYLDEVRADEVLDALDEYNYRIDVWPVIT